MENKEPSLGPRAFREIGKEKNEPDYSALYALSAGTCRRYLPDSFNQKRT
jgi:hypothetical protein